ncbi:MAG TPA: cytochrome c nitrite reductase small subunit [Thermoanaerobaculia bacterium]|nr:cytochrome c nitrite reductase small subunit [Thermoanaerobaculia bacterium]
MSRRTLMLALVVPATVAGLALGLGLYTFVYAKGASYLTNDPAACANCHVMRDHFSAWIVSSHRSVAACNDCHTPPGLIPKYAVKASNGFWHSFAFTTGRFPDPLRIKESNRRVTEQACRKCHSAITAMIDPVEAHRGAGPLSCIRCHRTVGHVE